MIADVYKRQVLYGTRVYPDGVHEFKYEGDGTMVIYLAWSHAVDDMGLWDNYGNLNQMCIRDRSIRAPRSAAAMRPQAASSGMVSGDGEGRSAAASSTLRRDVYKRQSPHPRTRSLPCRSVSKPRTPWQPRRWGRPSVRRRGR